MVIVLKLYLFSGIIQLYCVFQKPWNPNNIPIAIQVCAECGPDFAGHSHITYATFDKVNLIISCAVSQKIIVYAGIEISS